LPGSAPLLDAAGKSPWTCLITEAPSGHGGGFLTTRPRPLAKGSPTNSIFKLRAKVAVENLSDSHLSDSLLSDSHLSQLGVLAYGTASLDEAGSDLRRSAQRGAGLADFWFPKS